MSKLNAIISYLKKLFSLSSILLFLITTCLIPSNQSWALNNKTEGEKIFLEHCSGCHVNGGNIIRRNKTLKISDLKRNGLDNPEAIAKVAQNGIGSMSGYNEVLGEGGEEIVANWIWEQSQKAWFQG